MIEQTLQNVSTHFPVFYEGRGRGQPEASEYRVKAMVTTTLTTARVPYVNTRAMQIIE